MAREMMLEGGIVPKNVDKNYIVPERNNIARSNTRKRVVKPSPPKFTPRPNQYNDMKRNEAILQNMK